MADENAAPYEASMRDRFGVAALNALGHVLVSRAYRAAHQEVHRTAICCRLYHQQDITMGTTTQAKVNADAAFAVGALCGALGGVGRERLGENIQRRYEEAVAAQDAPENRPIDSLPPRYEAAQDYDDTFHVTEVDGGRTVAVCPTWGDACRVSNAMNSWPLTGGSAGESDVPTD